MTRTVVVVDDHAGFRSSARRLLEAAGFSVVGEAADGASALEVVRRVRPEVVLLDVQLPDLDGFEVARRLAEEHIAAAVILTSTRDASDYGDRLPHPTAAGFIGKDELSGARIAELAGCA